FVSFAQHRIFDKKETQVWYQYLSFNMVGEGGFAFLRKSHGGCSSPPNCCQEPPFESTKKQKDKLSLV
ncbi:MAG: hypothetical protein KIG31_00100, partial [Oscillospiraceae bacterium]|nr:hypothetical protein [Oscillospiraceae bacterium]